MDILDNCTRTAPMTDKGFFNVAYFVTDYLFDVIWALARTVLSPIFLIGWLLADDRPIGDYDWWPS